MSTKHGIIFNEDFMHFIASRRPMKRRVEKEEIVSFIDQYANTQVTDFLFNVNASLSYTPSKVLQTCFDKYLQKVENGVPVDYSESYLKVAYDIWVNQGIDLYQEWIAKCRKLGIRPWLSFRTNDCHDNMETAGLRSSDFFHEAGEKGLRRIRHREISGYYDCCLDYARQTIFDRMLSYIREQMERYDVDGMELDWMREMFCFVPGGEEAGREIINGFMRQAKNIADEAARRWGHPVEIMARVMRDPVQAYEAGFDYFTWSREGLINTLVITPRWASCDNNMPVDTWARILQGTGVKLAAGMEILSRTNEQAPYCCAHLEAARGNAAQFWSLGADKIYLFNYADHPGKEPAKGEHPSCVGKYYRELLTTIGAPETAVYSERHHMVTFQDIGPAWIKPEQILPLVCLPEAPVREKGKYSFVRIQTGTIPLGAKVTLLLGVRETPEAENIEVYINGTACRYQGEEKISEPYTSSPILSYAVENSSFPKVQTLELAAKEKRFVVDYIEIRVEIK